MSLIRSRSLDYKDIVQREESSSVSESSESEYEPIQQAQKMQLIQALSERIKLIVNSAMSDLEKDMLKTSVQLNLSEVLELYTKHYRAPTPLVNGYMPSQ